MPKFFFDIEEEDPDSIGVDLPDVKTARGEAIRAAAEILKDIDGSLTSQEWVMIVKDEAGQLLFELRFSIRDAA